MFGFKTLKDISVLTGIISKNIFDALTEGKTTIINTVGEEEKIEEIEFFGEDGEDVIYEGRENFVEVGFFPCENQNPEEIGPSEIFLSKIDLKGIERDSFNSDVLEIFDINFVNDFGKHKTEQFIKMKIKEMSL